MSTFVLSSPSSLPSRRIDYAKELNQEQLDVVLHGDGACLVLAGAGSGKTRTLTYRVAYLLEQGVDPSSILLLTFTNKAAREMLERVQSLLGSEATGLWGGTFHSIGSRILRAFAEPSGFQSNFTILDAEDAGDLIKAILKELAIDPKARRFPSASVVQDVISYARNAQEAIPETLGWKYPHFIQAAPEIEEIARRYQDRKKFANTLDFDDLLAFLAILLEDPRFGPSIAERFRYVLVDEYQDTNAIQARIVKGFASVHKNILVVGDDAQSIYAFRGADVKNILSFPKQWPDAKMFKLLTNYRSTPQILDLANESLSHNTEQFQKELVSYVAPGEKPKLVPCSSASQEARFVADQIARLRVEGHGLHGMAVLFRSSSHSQALEFELMKRNIPYEYRGGQKFFERAHIKDALSFLRVRSNVRDEVAWLRVLGLQEGIGAVTAANCAKALVQTTTWSEAIEAPQIERLLRGKAKDGWKVFIEQMQRMSENGDRPSSFLRGLLRSSYQEHLEKEYPNWRERLDDLEQLAIFAESYQDAASFLSDIALYDDIVASRAGTPTPNNDEEKMILSTIHQAKGLEWHTVFIIHLAEQSFPSRRALAEEGGIEEERRLFYVAVTRARRQLFLTYPMTVGFDALQFQQPSTFIEEVSPRHFDRVELREAGYGARRAKSPSEWAWEQGQNWDEPVIDRSDSRSASTTVWKNSDKKKPLAPGSFLRDVDEL